jgi:hypothetical protein
MTDRNDDLGRWLAAEEAGGEWDDADARFAAVASTWLPLAAAPSGLAARIMAAVPRPTVSPWARLLAALLASWWVRGTVGAALLVLGTAAAVVIIGQGITVVSAITALSIFGRGALAAVTTAWHAFTTVWPLASSLGDAAVTVAATPTVATVMLVNLALAAGALAGLTRMLAAGEES